MSQRTIASDAYRRNLEAVLYQLAPSAQKSGIRGDDFAQFVHVENRGRSVEVYGDVDGVCVAYWERGAASESHQSLHPSFEEAATAALAWLSS
jgi:hypothetical protein